jgi:cell division septation protein DedD
MRSPEPELYKDKIEVSLDGRQVFYLFFGGAVIACLVFVLGVMVGRRVEARAHVDKGAPTTAARDPLTALDQLDATARDEMSFRKTLAGGSATSEVDEAIAAIEKARAAKDEKPAAKKPEVVREGRDDAEAEAPEEPAPVAKPEPAPAPKPEVAEPEEKESKDKGKFTLQLSSFKDKLEAESFQADLKAAGYRSYLVQANVEGKGTFWRVRFGKYETYQKAIDAKTEFERKVNKIAYVTRL